MNILIFGAHPDDIEILCGGTSAKFKRLGHKVTHCVLTDGQVSSRRIPNQELVQIRKNEAKAAADVIGVDLVMCGIKDEMLFDDEDTRLKVLDVILTVRPDVIITMSDKDYASDHKATYNLVIAVIPMSVVKNCYSQKPCLDKHPVVYMMDTIYGIDFLPTEYVDISEDFDTKLKALRCHESQIEIGKELGCDYEEQVKVVSRFRGLQAGVRYAEGFQKLNNWYSGVTTRYLP
ncbi:MAG TPA: PIG-L family deacetylase [bacterium]|nr:PIG-L family deacetylase [bacterium]HOL49422.1 PIG-L family deacetylase [bacterium]HPO52252.1 PIG-L family deacetylase [bacterium]